MCEYCEEINKKYFSPVHEKDLRVYWIPQIPMKPFYYPADSIKDAKRTLELLAQYDLFQMEHNVKPDYANVGGLEVFEDGEWIDWYDEDGNDIDGVDENGIFIDDDFEDSI